MEAINANTTKKILQRQYRNIQGESALQIDLIVQIDIHSF